MRKVHLYIISCAALLLHTIFIDAQITREKLDEDIQYGSGVYHPYVMGDNSDTPAPKGYKPFYISHYGRHGCRYHTSPDKLIAAKNGLDLARDKELLTAKGRELLGIIDAQLDYSKGMWGELTERGAAEHKAIASRMYQRFKPVWNNKERRKVRSLSSLVQRCLSSELYSTHALKACAPQLDFSFTTGRRYFPMICPDAPAMQFTYIAEFYAAQMENELDAKPLFELIFNQPQVMEELVDPVAFARSVFLAWAIGESLDDCRFDLRNFLDMGQITALARGENNRILYGNLRNGEFGESRVALTSVLLREIVERAEEALAEGSEIAADLRYGHDTGLMPLLAYIGLDGYDVTVDFAGGCDSYDATTLIPMASNLQIVWYRNKANDILVKFLVNEQERSLSDIQGRQVPEPFVGVYYKWDEVREYLKGLYQ